MKPMIEVVITGITKGDAFIIPYSHADGLQFTGGKPVVYRVPWYEVRVEGGGSYRAIRFGLRNRGQTPPPAVRPCDAGLSAGRTCTPTWVPGYSPHSFAGGSRAGAWRLLPGKGFLIHEGADGNKGQIGGSLGCVEILDGQWNGFLGELEALGGQTCPSLGATGRLKVKIEPATYPVATLVP